jgi:hypothetical protein
MPANIAEALIGAAFDKEWRGIIFVGKRRSTVAHKRQREEDDSSDLSCSLHTDPPFTR